MPGTSTASRADRLLYESAGAPPRHI